MSIEKITKESVMLENTEKRCVNCRFYYPEPPGAIDAIGDLCTKKDMPIDDFANLTVCRDWKAKSSKVEV